VHFNSARTGVRLIGPKPAWARRDGGDAGLHPSNIHDTAYAIGALNFTGDVPIVLGPDGPSLGGFVCPVVIANDERWKTGQLRPGDRVRFVPHGATRSQAIVAAHVARNASEVDVVYRAAGEDNVLIEYGPLVLDIALRMRVQLLAGALAATGTGGIVDVTPGVRSLQIHFDSARLSREALIATLVRLERELPAIDDVEMPSRIVHLPLAWDDDAAQLAMRKYQELVRPNAPWCPSNIEFIRRINGLPSTEAVRNTVFDASYLVLGLGDVYLGAPLATPLDPRHRLVTTKYNPARTWTPENAVGIGGAYLCIYGMEGPGGYQLVGRTIQIWNSWRTAGAFAPGAPWLLRFFDRIRFFPVSPQELLAARDAFPHGRYPRADRRRDLPVSRLSCVSGRACSRNRAIPDHATCGIRDRTARMVPARPRHVRRPRRRRRAERRARRGAGLDGRWLARARERLENFGRAGSRRRTRRAARRLGIDEDGDRNRRTPRRHRDRIALYRGTTRRGGPDRRRARGMTLPQRLAPSALRAGYRAGSLQPEGVFTDVLARVRAYADPAVWIARVPDDDVLAAARALPRDAAALDRLPLYGLPFAVKDNIDIAGMPTTAGCPAFAFVPKATAFVVRRLQDAGAILIGKTNLDQFATGLVGTRSPHGAPRSVFDNRYISGGSSSGSAVAVAAGLCAFALGTDTAGSGRVPAAFNAIAGLKPTRGLLSTSGVLPACRSLDCVSIFAPGSADARAIARVARGFDPSDPYGREASHVSLATQRSRCGVLAAADREFFGDAESAALYEAAIERVRALGGTIVELDFAPFRETANLLYGGPCVAERLAAIEPFYETYAHAMDPTVRAIIGNARHYTAVDAYNAQYRLRALERRTAAQWSSIDVMLLPTAPTIYRVEDVAADPLGTNSRLGIYTNFVNLLDYCAVAVPAGFRSDGLPFGVSFVGPAFSDDDLVTLTSRFERPEANGGPEAQARPADAQPGEIALAVAGAHLSGFALNAELRALGATLVATTTTTPGYRLFALAQTEPPKPGLVRDPECTGDGIEVEVWSLTPAAFGTFVARLRRPMSIARVTLADGAEVAGFSCERYALADATDITAYGGWRAYSTRQV